MDIDNPELAVQVFAVGGHHPQKVDRAAWRRNIRVIPLRHEYDIAFPHDRGKLWFFVVGVDELDAE
jgi:hypothetical protein